MIFIDSNYWIYLFDSTLKEHKYVADHFKKIYDTTVLAINTVIMVEVMHYLVKRLGPTIANKKWQLFSSIDFTIGNLEFEQLNGIFEILSKYSYTGIGGRDATIISFMENHNITQLCTHDKAFTKIPNLEIIDPIPKDIDDVS
ncbi:MAG: type II toxin-antitoxin system VapC family toxin [Candidatus Lokiarchaeota archaeon]